MKLPNIKPLIGLNTDIEAGPPKVASVHALYFEAIEKTGGIPVLIPPMSTESANQLLEKLDGIMLIGGPDYLPEHYGEIRSEKIRPAHQDRQDFDIRLIQYILKKQDLPLLAICAGFQLLNIAMGGTLIQDIKTAKPESEIEHASPDGWHKGFASHGIKIERNTLVFDIYNTQEISVITSHHQAIKKLGNNLKATAYSDDGLIEAIELDSRAFTLGVQWHPERDFDNNQVLFQEFIQKAKRGK
jgi:putative glutamine amidotransferase